MAQSDKRERHPETPRTHSAEDVRGAEIILRTRTRKVIFFGALIAFVVLVVALGLFGLAGG